MAIKTHIKTGDLIYDPIRNEIGLVLACKIKDSYRQLVYYATSERHMKGKVCRITDGWLAFKYWTKLSCCAVDLLFEER